MEMEKHNQCTAAPLPGEEECPALVVSHTIIFNLQWILPAQVPQNFVSPAFPPQPFVIIYI